MMPPCTVHQCKTANFLYSKQETSAAECKIHKRQLFNVWPLNSNKRNNSGKEYTSMHEIKGMLAYVHKHL
jgi:hypothetical protein